MSIYEVSNDFMVRNTLLSIKELEYDQYEDKYTWIKKLFDSNSKVREGILVSSKSLYESIKTNKGDKEKIINSFLKYYIRMTTRTTPFGLFSGVTMGSFDEETEVKLFKDEQAIKRARPDAEWIFNLVGKLEKDIEVLVNLEVITSTALFEKGKRIENKLLTRGGNGEEEEDRNYLNMTINYTNLVKAVLYYARDGIKFGELLNYLVENIANIPKKKLQTFLIELIDKEYLITSLRPKITEENLLERIVDKLSSFEELVYWNNTLNNIQKLFDLYNSKSVGDGEEIFLILISEMKEVCSSKNFVQIDLKINDEKYMLNTNFKKEIEEFIDALQEIAAIKNLNPNLEIYRMDFMEKYSEGQEVPLLELIDEARGLGYPAGYTNPKNNKREMAKELNEEGTKIYELMRRKLTSYKGQINDVVQITTNEIKGLNINKIRVNDMPASFEINFLISENEEGGHLILGPNWGSLKAGKMFGRFIYLFDDNQKDKVKRIIDKSNDILSKSFIQANITSMLPSARSLNVTNSPNFLEYELPIGVTSSVDKEKTIYLNDLVIGNSIDGLYIKSKRLNKKVKFNAYNMLNHQWTYNITRFLLEISNDKQGLELLVPLAEMRENLLYTPRIMLNNIVLFPKKWAVNFDVFIQSKKKVKFEEFKNNFKEWAIENNLSEYFYLSNGDNRLLLNINDEAKLKLLYLDLIKNKSEYIKLEEFIGNIENSGIKIESVNYATEIVVPVVRKIHDEEIIKENINKNIDIDENERCFLPFSKWIYLKLYIEKSRENEFLTECFNKFMNNLVEKNIIKKYFFIRYEDDKKHIRLRMLKNNDYELEFYQLCKEFLDKMYKEKIINHVIIDTYIREIERYGGEKIINEAEEMFYRNSQVTIKLLEFNDSKIFKFNNKVIAMISVIKILDDLGLSYKQQLEHFDKFISQEQYRKEFNSERKTFIKLLNSDNNWSGLREITGGNELLAILDIQTEALIEYSNKIKELKNKNQLVNSQHQIIGATMHMFCNRFLGLNRELENEVLAIARHTLYSIKYFKENKER